MAQTDGRTRAQKRTVDRHDVADRTGEDIGGAFHDGGVRSVADRGTGGSNPRVCVWPKNRTRSRRRYSGGDGGDGDKTRTNGSVAVGVRARTTADGDC